MERRQGALSLLVLCAAFAFANAAPWSRVDEIVPESEEPDVTLATVPLVRQERSEETHRKLMDFIDLTHTRKVHPIRLIDETSHQRLVSEVTLQNADMVEYYGPVTIAGQTIKAVFDTGSGICWAASEECHMDACEAHTQLKVNKRVHLENGTVGIKYGTGHMSGLRASSLVQVGSVAVHDQDFLLSTHEYGDVFKNGVFDGVMGFGRINLANILRKPGDAEGRGDPFYMRAISQNLVATPQFSIYVSSKDDKPGAMVIGGTNKKLYNGKVTWHTGLSDSYWEVQLDGIRLEGQDSGTHDTMMLTDVTDGDDSHRKCRAIADSGTSLLVGPEHMIKPLLPYIKVHKDCSNMGDLRTVHIYLPDEQGVRQQYSLTPEEYVMKRGDSCTTGIAIMTLHLSPEYDTVILGDTFLRKYYSVYDVEKNRVGFAEANHGADSGTHIPELDQIDQIEDNSEEEW